MKKTIEFGYIKYEFEEGWGGGEFILCTLRAKTTIICVLCVALKSV